MTTPMTTKFFQDSYQRAAQEEGCHRTIEERRVDGFFFFFLFIMNRTADSFWWGSVVAAMRSS